MLSGTRTFPYSDSSDDDLPSFPSFGNIILKEHQKKTFDELFKENSDLIADQRQQKDLEEIAIQVLDTLNDDDISLPGDGFSDFYANKFLEETVLDEKNETDTFEVLSLRFFGELNHLQFITWDDLTLPKCGFDSSLDFSQLENLLIALNKNELQEEIKCCEAFSPKNLKQLNPFVQYAFKTMSLHTDAAYVNACQKFIRKTLKSHYIQSISISYVDIFMVLFNYGVDVKKDIFNMLPGNKEIQKCKNIQKIPQNWRFNLKAVLSSIGDLMEHCKMQEDDLFNIFVYFLWMGMDDFLNLNMALQLCSEIILCKFSTMNWHVWRWKIVQFVISTNALKSNQWNLFLKMINCIHCETPRGVELRKYLSYIALRKLTDSTTNSNFASKYFIPKYSENLFSVKNLQPILESICDMKKNLQIVAIEFINLLTMSLKLSIKDEHSKLLISLKKCENSISHHATVQQSRLCIIYSRISTLTPCENMKQVLHPVEKQEDTPVEEDASIQELEIDSHSSESPLNQQSFCEEPKAGIASYASNDKLQKQDASLQSIITDQGGNQEIAEELISKEKFPDITSLSSLDQPLVKKQLKENSVFTESEEILQNEDNSTLKNIINGPLALKKENSEDKNPEELNVTHLPSMNEQLVGDSFDMFPKGGHIALELTVSSAVPNPETNLDVELKASSQRLDTESDIETETSSEGEDSKSDQKMEMSSEGENYVTPTKSFISDHRYARKKCTTYSSVNPSKDLNTCLEKLAQSNNQCINKLHHSTNRSEGKNLVKNIEMAENSSNNSATCAKKIPNPNIQEPLLDKHLFNENEAFDTDFVNTERHQILSSLQTSNIPEARKAIKVDSSVIEHIIKNPTDIPLTPIRVHFHHVTEFETLTKAVKPVDETMHVDAPSYVNSLHIPDVKEPTDTYSQACSIENPNALTCINKSEGMGNSLILDSENPTNTQNIVNVEVDHSLRTEISSHPHRAIQKDLFQSMTLQNLISSQNLNSSSISENSRNDRNVISNIELIDKGKPSELVKSDEVDNIEVPIDSPTFEKMKITQKTPLISGSSSLYLYTKNCSNTSSAFPEKITHLDNNINICDKKCESVPQANAENIHFLPPSMTDAFKSSKNNANISNELLNKEKNQNVVGLQPKDSAISTPSECIAISMYPSKRSDAVNESNPTKNVTSELFSRSAIPEARKTEGSARVSPGDATTNEKFTSSTITMSKRDLDPLYCDVVINKLNSTDILMNTTKESKESDNFIPRSVHIKTAKIVPSPDLRVVQKSENKSTPNFQNSNMEKKEILNISEKNNSDIDSDTFSLGTKMDNERGKTEMPFLQISDSLETFAGEAKIDMFYNESEIDEREGHALFRPNIVRLQSVEDMKSSDVEKINGSDHEKHKKFHTPCILGDNQELPAYIDLKPTNKPVPSVDDQNIASPIKQLSQIGTSSKIQPHSDEFSTKTFPNTSCPSPKRKHTDFISHLASKRPRGPKAVLYGSTAWSINFPASLSPGNLNRQNEVEIGPVGPLTNNSSSVYYTAICNAQLVNENLATKESSEAITDRSSDAEPIKDLENSEIINSNVSTFKKLSDSDSSSLSDSDSSSLSDSDSSSSTCSLSKINSSSETSHPDSTIQSQPKIPSINKLSNQDKNNHFLKDSQAVQGAVVDFLEKIPSDSEDEIQIIEEISNVTTAKTKFSNSLPSRAINKRQKHASFNSTRQTPNQNSTKTPTKPKQSSQTKDLDVPRNRPVSHFHFLKDSCTDNQRPKSSIKSKSRTPTKIIKPELRTPKKFGNPEQRAKKSPIPSSVSSSVKKSRLIQTSLTSVPDIKANASISCPKASSSQNKDDDIECLNISDSECIIIDSDIEIITVD